LSDPLRGRGPPRLEVRREAHRPRAGRERARCRSRSRPCPRTLHAFRRRSRGDLLHVRVPTTRARRRWALRARPHGIVLCSSSMRALRSGPCTRGGAHRPRRLTASKRSRSCLLVDALESDAPASALQEMAHR
jgi:hypothetical protein